MLSPEKFYDKDRLLARLKARTKITSDNHWLWIGKTTIHNRGVIIIGGRYGKDVEIHRVSAYIHHDLNLKDTDQHALHKNSCPYTNCWNPDCLYVGTHADNMNDIKQLPNFRCGHSKIGNSKIKTSGAKQCKICHNQYNQRRRNILKQLKVYKKLNQSTEREQIK